eukprot:5525126-Pleurochrysis_carterae.AAC.1
MAHMPATNALTLAALQSLFFIHCLPDILLVCFVRSPMAFIHPNCPDSNQRPLGRDVLRLACTHTCEPLLGIKSCTLSTASHTTFPCAILLLGESDGDIDGGDERDAE